MKAFLRRLPLFLFFLSSASFSSEALIKVLQQNLGRNIGIDNVHGRECEFEVRDYGNYIYTRMHGELSSEERFEALSYPSARSPEDWQYFPAQNILRFWSDENLLELRLGMNNRIEEIHWQHADLEDENQRVLGFHCVMP